jgi:chemotaxis protein MotC
MELAEILRAGAAHGVARPAAGLTLRMRTAVQDAERLKPEDILFNAPQPLRAEAPPPMVRARVEPVPVPRLSPHRAGAPVPADHPRRRASGGRTVPAPSPAPRRAAPMLLVDANRAAPPAAEPVGANASGSLAVPRPVPWERSGAGQTPLAAAATPFITLWPSADTEARTPNDDTDNGNQVEAADRQTAQPNPAAPPGPPPYRLVRMLTAVQDDIARGAGAALDAQSLLQQRLAQRFSDALPHEWDERRNARALVIYALSGGSPAVVRRVLEDAHLAPPYDALAAGALAYLEGRAGDARRHFAAAGDAPLDASLAGPVLLARAALAVEADPRAALALLERARAAAPASLVEEAAVRRALFVAAEIDDIGVFDQLVARYLRKFRRSLYAGNFRQRLASALTRMSFIEEPAAFVRLESMVEPMTEAGRRELYLLLARAAIENGNRLAAEIAAERALEAAASGTLDARRAALYKAAAEVVDPEEFRSARSKLSDLEDDGLPEDDRALLYAARRLSRTVADLPVAPADAPISLQKTGAAASGTAPRDHTTSPSRLEPPAAEASFDVAAVERRVAEAIDRIDALLEDTP